MLINILGYGKSLVLQIEIFGEKRGSYSKTDYMGNDQLLPTYNLQIGVCEEYIATVDVKQYASDMDCFVP